jgi:hypothetical protein
MRVILTALALFAAAIATPSTQPSQEILKDATEKAPKDSVKLIVTGCVEDRVLRAADIEIPDDQEAPVIDRELFRLSGKKDVMAEVKRLEGRQLSITGIVRKIDLQEPGFQVGGGRVVIGAPTMDPRRPPLPDTTERPIVLEVRRVAEGAGSCR